MLKDIRYNWVILGLLLPITGYAQMCNNVHADKFSLRTCDLTFTAVPTYPASVCVASSQTGTYTIKNNTPIKMKLNYLRVKNNDGMPDLSTVINVAGTNNCGSSLASGASCNIVVMLRPLILGGKYNRTLQIGIDSRQVELDGAAITTAVDCPATGPVAPPNPVGPGAQTLPASLVASSILAYTTVTNTGSSIIAGDVDLSPGTAIVGFPPGVITGVFHATDAIAAQTMLDANVFYTALKGKACPAANDFSAVPELGGKTLTVPGVYCFSSTAQITGPIPLTLVGSATDAYTFQIGSTLVTGSAGNVVLAGGLVNSNVNWAVGSSATIGATSTIRGNIDANNDITLVSGANLYGRAWALNGAVTLDSNIVNPSS